MKILLDVTTEAGLLDDLISPKAAAALLGVSRRRVNEFIASGRLPAVNVGGAGRGARYVLRRGDVEAFDTHERREGRPRKGDTAMIAVEITLTTGTFFIPLPTWNNGSHVRLPMGGGERVLSPQDVRTNWDAWVSDLVDEAQLLTREELDAQHPGMQIA